ncbi:MAG: endonuclease Q family protein [Candidatus Diapherotrites archaeon]
MKEFNCDLHFHGPQSSGVSKNMLLPVIAKQSELKGLHVVSSADLLNAKWFEHVKKNLTEEENNVFSVRDSDTKVILGTEINCNKRVHHLIYFPSIESALELKEKLKGKAIFDSWGCGRPTIHAGAEEIAEQVKDIGGIIGPAHAFTPYFSVYAHFNSLKELYGEQEKNIYFMELGLSADTNLADLISENHKYNFLTNSDSHSPWPFRIGREFNRIKMLKPNFDSLKKALKEKEEKLITLNVGLNPREGKYHLTACTKCFAKYSLEQSQKLNFKCMKCAGEIKKGVKDRIMELKDSDEGIHPKFRPPYMHSVPLAEIIQSHFKVKNVNSVKVQSNWQDLIDKFKTEITILVDAPIEEIIEENSEIGKTIDSFRKGFIVYDSGGGGNYGTPYICHSIKECELKRKEIKEKNLIQRTIGQKTLGEY